MLSLVWIAFELNSYARCATIIFTISLTVETFDISRNLWIDFPNPSNPGRPASDVPEAGVCL